MRALVNSVLILLFILFSGILVCCVIEDMNRLKKRDDFKTQQRDMELKEWRIKYLPEVYDENGNKR